MHFDYPVHVTDWYGRFMALIFPSELIEADWGRTGTRGLFMNDSDFHDNLKPEWEGGGGGGFGRSVV